MRELDRAMLDRLRRIGGEKLLRAMLASFEANGVERIATARAAAARGDRDGVTGAAHALKSSAGNVGASDLQALAARVEAEARSAETDLGSLAAELADAFEVARAAARAQSVASAAAEEGGRAE